MSGFEAVDWQARTGPYRGLHSPPGGLALSLGYLLVSLAGIAVYPSLSETGKMIDYLVVSFAPVPAIMVGLSRTPAGNRRPFWFLLAALVSFNAGNVAWYWYVFAMDLPTGDGTIASVFAALAQIFMFCGAIAIVVRRGRNDVGGLIDSTIMSMVVGGVIWDFVLLPQMDSVDAPALTQIATCVMVFMLTGILGCLVRLLLTAREFIPALWFLVAAMAFSLTGVITVALVVEPGTAERPAFTDMVYLAGYTAVGLCALARSVVRLLGPGRAPKDELSVGRLVFLGLSLAALPAVGGARELLGQPVDATLLAVGTAAVTPLVMARIWRVWSERMRVLRYQASHDTVTGLPNRPEFVNRLTDALRTGRRLVVVFCEVDEFKEISDRFGHAGADELVRGVAERLRGCVRETDTVSRFGGDQFVMLWLDGDTDDAGKLSRRVEKAFREPFRVAGEPVVMGANLGVVCDNRGEADDLVRRADAAMYVAKQERRVVPGARTRAAFADDTTDRRR
ncbi:diguanylate cyclase (GGDEF) domain-containing protein [Micromonospora pattaloongensis]|uniref:Diguanylate cyclase (GGDEF) domain-containing protein n=1 Tax=Micromonospora pattaloongensis TaxID=405436 RepID=A0A1H3NIX8_9ACTN|nr:GGDEF domain-containing protein [Micromonospora pattaloongensis]SDY88744.1 diguanylate cyclase (GGDEF) domain-containing protein [Micromonospora pattaloongensis]